MPAPVISGITDNLFPFAQRGWSDSLNGSINDSAATITFNSLAGYTDGQSVLIWLEPKTDNEELVYGIVSGVTIVSAVRGVLGTAASHSSGAAATEYVSSAHYDLMRKGILESLNQDGTLKVGAVHSADVLAANVVTTAKILNENVTTGKIADAAVTPTKRSGGFAVGTILINGSGAKSVTGLDFQPRLVTFELLTSTSVSAQVRGSGAADGTNQWAISSRATEAGDTSIQSRTNACILSITTDAANDNVATFTSFNSDGFTVNVTVFNTTRTWGFTAYA